MSARKFNTAELLELLSNGENKDLGRYFFILIYVPEIVRSWRRSGLELDTIESIWIKICIGRTSVRLQHLLPPCLPTSLPWWPWRHAWPCMWWTEGYHYHGRYKLWHSVSQLSNKPAIIHHGWPPVNPAHHWPDQSYSQLPNHHWSLLCLILCLSCILRNCSTSWKWPSHDLRDSTTLQCGESCTHISAWHNWNLCKLFLQSLFLHFVSSLRSAAWFN